MDELAQFVRTFSMSMQAQRLTDFGWEQTVNDLSPERLRELAKHLPNSAAVFLMAADEKEKADGTI